MPVIDTKKSKIKLLVYIPQVYGNDYPMTFYSFFTKNKYSNEKNIADMSKRILENKLHSFFSVAIFYDNITKKELKRIQGFKANAMSFDKEKSKVKLLVYVPDLSAHKDILYIRYSPLVLNSRAIMDIVEMMKNMLSGLYKNKFRTALFYENLPENAGRLLHKEFGDFYNN